MIHTSLVMNYINCLIFVFVLNLVIMKGSSKLYKNIRRVYGPAVLSNRDYPFMAFITLQTLEHYSIIPEDNDGFCTGTIINPKHVLTAAHCATNCSFDEDPDDKKKCKETNCLLRDINKLSVLTGNIAIKKAKSRAGVARVSVHPEFKPCDLKNKCLFRYDIAILELDIFLHFTNKVMSVDLPKPVNIKDSPLSTVHTKYKECLILGWGKSSNNDNFKTSERTLTKATIPLIGLKECIQRMELESEFEDKGLCKETSFCTYDPKHRNGICHGDSGGPLICNGTQVGVVSWSDTSDKSKTCAQEHIPDVYTRTDINVVWINEIMANAPGVKRFIPQPKVDK